MNSRFHRLFTVTALAGALASAAAFTAPGIASADGGNVNLAVSCRDGACRSNEPSADARNELSSLLRRPSDNPLLARRAAPPQPRTARPAAVQPRTAVRPTAVPSRTVAAPSPQQRIAPPRAPQQQVRPLRASNAKPPVQMAYGSYSSKDVQKDPGCSANHASGDVALVCGTDVKNNLQIGVKQWGHGNQVNIAVFFQNINQFAVSGSGNASNTAADNSITADVSQANETHK